MNEYHVYAALSGLVALFCAIGAVEVRRLPFELLLFAAMVLGLVLMIVNLRWAKEEDERQRMRTFQEAIERK